jgi:hypothetical protein
MADLRFMKFPPDFIWIASIPIEVIEARSV